MSPLFQRSITRKLLQHLRLLHSRQQQRERRDDTIDGNSTAEQADESSQEERVSSGQAA